ncbi:MAG TPA: methylcrotonoyl-CoA carboxylase [Erythrobacter sp.]|nr:methylcrotonoyl-CoA carboxylase [Erythrobacter sp.]
MSRILIANRGEIALRIHRAAHEMGIETVAVHSTADADAMHVRLADHAVCIGPPSATDSYLNVANIISAAEVSHADAIHPGYGFLSENAKFAEIVEAHDIAWIGPKPEHIRTMGDKVAAKRTAGALGLPLVPGSDGAVSEIGEARAIAAEIGYPVIIKAASGGGGRGMKVCESEDQLETLMQQAGNEAKAAFGDATVYIEKYLGNPRHIEFQVFGDGKGNAIHLGERDCSLQRRHQKVIEEAPAPGMDEATRQEICAAAVRAAKAVDYEGAGTIEFIADASEGLRADRIFFMEMNTRLQVEHPVTEEITGVDLVEWQLRVASGEPIPLQQEDLAITGHAIEARLYAEDPSSGFLPSTGPLDHFDLGSEGRIETGVAEGDMISPHYDPMVAKLVVWEKTRADAIEALADIAESVEVWPVKTNAAFLANALLEDDFVEAQLDTGFIERKLDRLVGDDAPDDAIWQAAADFTVLDAIEENAPRPIGFRLNADPRVAATLFHKGESRTVDVIGERGAAHATGFVEDARTVVFADGQGFEFALESRGSGAAAAGSGAILAPMPGKVIAVDVAEGDRVTAGQRLMVLEAMKMEHALTAPFDGTVTELSAATGGQVQVEAVLAVVAPAEE